MLVKTDELLAVLEKIIITCVLSHPWSISGPHRGLAGGEQSGAGVRDDGVLSRGQSQRQHSWLSVETFQGYNNRSINYHQRHLSNCSFHNWKSRQQRPLRVSSLKFSYFLYGKRNQKAHKYENDQADQDIDILSTSNLWTNTKFLVPPVKLWVLSIYSCSTMFPNTY